MSKRFAIVIGVAAAGVMALGAQTATALPARCTVSSPCSYGTHLTITADRGPLFHGFVLSGVRKCEVERRVVLFRQDRGADTRLGMALSDGGWGVRVRRAQLGWRVYAKARHKVRDRYVCFAGGSPTYTWPSWWLSDSRL
jgi:hypothetical protein